MDDKFDIALHSNVRRIKVRVTQRFGGNHMNATFHDFVDKLVKQTDGNQVNKNDLYEEIMSHLEKSRAQFIKDGFDERQAEQKAIENYRSISGVDGQVQQVISPHENRMLLILAIASVIYSFVISSIWLYLDHDTNIVWFLISVTNSSFVYLCAVKPIYSLSRKLWLNIILIIHMFIYIFGAFLIFGLKGPISIILALLSLFIILLSIVLVSLTTVNNKQPNKHKLSKQIKLLHALNITAGIITFGATILILWLLLGFSGEMTLGRTVIFLPLFIWLISYFLQIKFITKNKKQVAYALAVIPGLLLIIIVVFLIMMIFA